MRFDEVVKLLRQQEKLRAQVAMVDAAMEQLDEEERDIIETMVVKQERLASEKLCEKFCVERPTVYRRREKAMKKLGIFLEELRDKSEMFS